MGKLVEKDSNNVFGTNQLGNTTVTRPLHATYNPSIERLGSGFAIADRGAITHLSTDLREVERVDIPDLGLPTQTQGSSSPSGDYAAFSFNEGTAEDNGRHRIVLMSPDKAVTSIHTHGWPLSLTACNDGTAKWLEYSSKERRAAIVSLDQDGHRSDIEIDWVFLDRPGPRSALGCEGADSFIDTSGDDRRIIRLRSDGSTDLVVQFPRFGSPHQVSAYSHVADNRYFSLDRAGGLTRVNLETGNIEEEHSLNFNGANPVSFTYDSGKIYVVTQDPEESSAQSVTVTDAADFSCTSRPIPLTGFNGTTNLVRRLTSSSFMIVNSIMAVDPQYQIPC